MKGSIFLSASVPTHGREFFDTSHPYQIHTAVRSLLLLALGRQHIVFGGHPSITPMVHSACLNFGITNINCVSIYQTAYFKDDFPLENQDFMDIRVVPAEDSLAASVDSMREHMFSDNHFSAGVFIGGMNGILHEYKIFKDRFPDASIIVVRAGGGAAATIPETQQDHEIQELEHSREYFSLFTQALKINPQSERHF